MIFKNRTEVLFVHKFGFREEGASFPLQNKRKYEPWSLLPAGGRCVDYYENDDKSMLNSGNKLDCFFLKQKDFSKKKNKTDFSKYIS